MTNELVEDVMEHSASSTADPARCCIAGGGPAGMMLGLLLARAGVEVVVLEKHADFLRDFRGDTVHPSTLELMAELGLLDEFLKLPHQEARELQGHVGDMRLTVADFSHLPTRCKFVALMPQWDFLNFLSRQGARYRAFRLEMQAEVTDLIEADGRIAGVRFQTPAGMRELRADLVVGADGRHSTVRSRAQLEVMDIGAPMDVLWMRLSHRPTDSAQSLGRFDAGRIMVLIDRGDYWQCAFVIPKGGLEQLQEKGITDFRAHLAELVPFLADRVDELRDWSDIKLLTVAVDRLRRWYRPGLICIGDAAHAMSPIGGVGINLAIQDAVAAANILHEPLRRRTVGLDDLAKVQRRRELPTRLTQGVQVLIQNRIIRPVLGRTEKLSSPWPVRLLRGWPALRRIPARLIGMGVRPEHVRTPDVGRKTIP
jgi:2-polyprenyl-6-methoxyphenol hydroxylase-like FAD-dependent oxidoreductase